MLVRGARCVLSAGGASGMGNGAWGMGMGGRADTAGSMEHDIVGSGSGSGIGARHGWDWRMEARDKTGEERRGKGLAGTASLPALLARVSIGHLAWPGEGGTALGTVEQVQ